MAAQLLFLLIGLSAASTAYGGSKGFTVVMMDIGAQKFFESSVYKANANGNFSETKKWRDCWERRATGGKTFALVIKKNIPAGMTQEMARAIWDGNRKAAESAQKILSNTKTLDEQSIDGMYVINARDGRISVMALGSRGKINAKNPSGKVSVRWNRDDPGQGAADFDLALCSISHPLDIGFSP